MTMNEPDPNKYKTIQNYINALKRHWENHGGPANQNRAIAFRLKQYWNEIHENKKNRASLIKNMQNKFHNLAQEVGKRRNRNSNSNSNSYASTAPRNLNTNALKNLANEIKKESRKYATTSVRLNNITHAIQKRKLVPKKYINSIGTWHTHQYLRKKGIKGAKEQIRRDYSLRTLNRAISSLPFPQNVVNIIKKKANVPTQPVTRTKNRVSARPYGNHPNLPIYKNGNGRFFFVNTQGRWYLMNSPNQRWEWNNTKKQYKPWP
jgi:DNA repair exonuclease SbcCD ATPase subunit